jgi:S1 RNA binding domain protein
VPGAPAETPAEGTAEVRLAAKGEIVEATVRRIAPFGAFVRLPDGRKGLIHISQVADEFVDDIKQHLEIGQVVRARITAVAEDGKVDLSIKKAKPRPKPKQPPRPKRGKRPEHEQAEAQPPNKTESFHVNPLSDVLMDVEKKLK